MRMYHILTITRWFQIPYPHHGTKWIFYILDSWLMTILVPKKGDRRPGAMLTSCKRSSVTTSFSLLQILDVLYHDPSSGASLALIIVTMLAMYIYTLLLSIDII